MNKPYVLVSGDFVRTGGMDMANYALASYLAESGTEVHLVAHSTSAALLKHGNVRFHRVPKLAKSHLLSSPGLDLTGRRCASRIARCGGRVVVNGGNCRWGDLNWVHYLHAVDMPRVENDFLRRLKCKFARRFLLTSESRTLGIARVVIANSNATRGELVHRFGIPAERVHTVYYGIAPDLFRPPDPDERLAARRALEWPDGKPVVVFIGALSDRRKGFDTVFSAWAKLCADRQWDADLAVVGIGSELASWRRKATEQGLVPRIRFLGFRSDVHRVLAAGDALVAPARYEAYGLAVHESLCCGLPALVTHTAGVAERYPREIADLLIRNPDDPAELVARLWNWRRECASYKARVLRLSDTLRSRTWHDMAAEIRDIAEANS